MTSVKSVQGFYDKEGKRYDTGTIRKSKAAVATLRRSLAQGPGSNL